MRILSLAWGNNSTRTLYTEVLRQREVIAELESRNRVLSMAMDKVDLQHAKATRDLVSHFLDAVEEEGGEALRDGIEAGLADLKDHVARLEEHAS
jgi:hypothetical protein